MNRFNLAAVAAVLLAGPAWAAGAPRTLTEEGFLTDASGNPIEGTVAITFSLYAARSGGAARWSEPQLVTVTAGYFSALLGLTNPLPESAFDGGVEYIGIKVGSDAEMTPRQPVASVPYALVSSDATGDIHPSSISVDGQTVVNANGEWVGPPTGSSEGYATSADHPGRDPSDSHAVSVELDLPAGSYFVTGKASAYNAGSSGQNLNCKLVDSRADPGTGSSWLDTSGNYVPVGGYGTDPLAANVVLPAGGTIRLKCFDDFGVLPGTMHLLAQRIGAYHVQ